AKDMNREFTEKETNNFIKRCSILFVIRDIIKENYREIAFTFSMYQINKDKKLYVLLVQAWGTGSLICWLWDTESVQHLWMAKSNKHIYQLANVLLLGINPNTFGQNKVCTKLFMEALFVGVKFWKPPKCPSKKDCLNKLYCTEPMEHFAALK
ncbi:LORF2 protein, partial [Crocuta crocuta]